MADTFGSNCDISVNPALISNWQTDTPGKSSCRLRFNVMLTGSESGGNGQYTSKAWTDAGINYMSVIFLAVLSRYVNTPPTADEQNALDEIRRLCGTESDSNYVGVCTSFFIGGDAACSIAAQDFARKNGISARDAVSLNKTLNQFCGCFSPQDDTSKASPGVKDLMNNYFSSKECDSLCSTPEPIKIGGIYPAGDNFVQARITPCQRNLCLIDNVLVNQTASNGGKVSFNQICNVCSGKDCACVINAKTFTDLKGVATKMNISHKGNCNPQGSVYYTSDDGKTFTADELDGGGGGISDAALIVILVILGIVALFALIYILWWLHRRSEGKSGKKDQMASERSTSTM